MEAHHSHHTLIHSLEKLSVSELFFEVPKNYFKAQDGSLRLFARSAERFEKPVDISKKRSSSLHGVRILILK